jgi:hypothetical protein
VLLKHVYKKQIIQAIFVRCIKVKKLLLTPMLKKLYLKPIFAKGKDNKGRGLTSDSSENSAASHRTRSIICLFMGLLQKPKNRH